MRLLRVEPQDFYTGEIKALVPVDDLTLMIGRNGAGKSRIIEEWLRRRGPVPGSKRAAGVVA